MEGKRILVFGLGATGGIFACHLADSGNKVFGLDPWRAHADAVREGGIRLTGLTTLSSGLEEVAANLTELSDRDFDYVIVAVKTPYMADVVSDLASLDGDYRVVSLQNGLDNEDYFARFIDKDRVLRVSVNYAGNVTAPGVIEMAFFHKPNFVGCLCEEGDCEYSRELAGIMSAGGLETESTDEIKKFTWRKAILNAALSPVSALLGITMAEVMKNEETRGVVEMLLKEGIEVASAAGYEYGDEFFEQCLDYLSSAGPHKPSMLIDIENGKPTEIDYINGKIAYYGNELNVPVSVSTTLTALVKAKERESVRI